MDRGSSNALLIHQVSDDLVCFIWVSYIKLSSTGIGRTGLRVDMANVFGQEESMKVA